MSAGTTTRAAQDVALSIRGLTLSLPMNMERSHAVTDVSFDLNRGQILCVIGESGSGKSVSANAVERGWSTARLSRLAVGDAAARRGRRFYLRRDKCGVD